MAVGFLFEADVAVGLHAVAVLDEQDEPLEEVPDEEGQIEEFLLLGGMDELMVDFPLAERFDGEDEAKQADGQEVFPQQKAFDQVYFMLLALHVLYFPMQKYNFSV